MKKSELPQPCRTCRYVLELYGGDWICDYNSQMNRLRGCLMDDKCIRYEPRGKSKKPLGAVDLIK